MRAGIIRRNAEHLQGLHQGDLGHVKLRWWMEFWIVDRFLLTRYHRCCYYSVYGWIRLVRSVLFCMSLGTNRFWGELVDLYEGSEYNSSTGKRLLCGPKGPPKYHLPGEKIRNVAPLGKSHLPDQLLASSPAQNTTPRYN